MGGAGAPGWGRSLGGPDGAEGKARHLRPTVVSPGQEAEAVEWGVDDEHGELAFGEMVATGPYGQGLDHVAEMAGAGLGALADWLPAICCLQPGPEARWTAAGAVGLADVVLHRGQRPGHVRSLAGSAENGDDRPDLPAPAGAHGRYCGEDERQRQRDQGTVWTGGGRIVF